jgi:hypothetical protein
MSIVVSAEMVRLLGILAACPKGSSHHELTTQGVKSSLTFEAVMLNIVRVKREQGLGLAAYRFHILPAGIQLLDVQG